MQALKLKKKNNPYGANQWHADPRQQLFLAYYLDPKSKTFANALQSALKAGFEKNYAENITTEMPDWLKEKLGNISPMLLKAERNLMEMMDLPSETHAMGAFGPLYKTVKEKVKGKNGRLKTVKKKEPIMAYNSGLLKIKNDASKFVAERVGRNKYGPKIPEGGDIYNVIVFANEQRAKIAQRIIGGGSVSDSASEE